MQFLNAHPNGPLSQLIRLPLWLTVIGKLVFDLTEDDLEELNQSDLEAAELSLLRRFVNRQLEGTEVSISGLQSVARSMSMNGSYTLYLGTIGPSWLPSENLVNDAKVILGRSLRPIRLVSSIVGATAVALVAWGALSPVALTRSVQLLVAGLLGAISLVWIFVGQLANATDRTGAYRERWGFSYRAAAEGFVVGGSTVTLAFGSTFGALIGLFCGGLRGVERGTTIDLGVDYPRSRRSVVEKSIEAWLRDSLSFLGHWLVFALFGSVVVAAAATVVGHLAKWGGTAAWLIFGATFWLLFSIGGLVRSAVESSDWEFWDPGWEALSGCLVGAPISLLLVWAAVMTVGHFGMSISVLVYLAIVGSVVMTINYSLAGILNAGLMSWARYRAVSESLANHWNYPGSLSQFLDAAVKAGILYPVGDGYRFIHRTLQEVLAKDYVLASSTRSDPLSGR